MRQRRFVLASLLCLLTACASESHRTVETETVQSAKVPYSGPVSPIAVGKMVNSSPYLRGIFSDSGDQLGGQAKTILKTHLAQSGRFDVVDRDNLEQLDFERATSGAAADMIGAQYVVTGEVTEFGRKETGDKQVFGILGRGKEQVAYSKVSLNVVDVTSSKIVYAVQGAGEYSLENREVLGTGGTAGYDSTLNGKVLNLSIADAVDKLIAGMERGEWKAAR